ncbi:hypothetical protein BH09VER1_BH09VER1_35110 [soil metagenome]
MKPIDETAASSVDPTPRIALFLSDESVLMELEKILRSNYSSLLVITDREKLKEFSIPLLIVVDTINDVALIRESHLVEGTQILVVTNSKDSETCSAAFDAGAADYLNYPFVPENVIRKTEKYLEPFRHAQA